MADAGNNGLFGIDPDLLMSLGSGLLAGSRYGSNAGEGLLQGMQSYRQGQQLKMAQAQNAQSIQLGAQQLKLNDQSLQKGGMDLDYQKQLNALIMQRLNASVDPQTKQQLHQLGGLMDDPKALPAAAGSLMGNPAPQGAAPPVSPQGPPQSVPSMPSWLAPPTPQNISSINVGGLPSDLAPIFALRAGKDPVEAAKGTLDAQRNLAQQQYAPEIAKIQSVVGSNNPVRDIKADPQLFATWQHYASARGLDPAKDLNQQNAQQVFSDLGNTYRQGLGMPTEKTPEFYTTQGHGVGGSTQTEVHSGKITPGASEVETAQFILPDKSVQLLPKAVGMARGYEPFTPSIYGNQQLQGSAGDLLAALTTKGVSLPSGARGQNQQATVLNSLIRANPGKSADDIADMVRTGQLDFNGAKRSTGQLASVAAATDASNLQLEKNFASLDPLVAKMGKTSIPIVDRSLAQLRQNWQSGGDKDTAQFVGLLRAVAGEYAKLRSGGTGSANAPEGEQKEALAVMNNAFSTGGYEGLKAAIQIEAQNKRDSYREGIRNAAATGASVGANSPSAPAAARKLTYDPATGTFK